MIRKETASNFLKIVGPKLYEKEAEYGMLLGICENQVVQATPASHTFFVVSDKAGSPLTGFCLTEKSLIIPATSAAVLLDFSKFLGAAQRKIPGVVGPSKSSESFARMWSKATSSKMKLAMNQKIYQLDQVQFPEATPGSLSVADPSRISLVTQWLIEFSKESLPHEKIDRVKIQQSVQSMIERQKVFLWLDEKKVPVAMDIAGRSTQHGVSISGVYTPKEFRKRGFASSLVAHTSQRMLDQGKNFCVLYTDLTNPTSNRIYQKIGYKEIADSKAFIFD